MPKVAPLRPGKGKDSGAGMVIADLVGRDDRQRLEVAQRLHQQIAGNLVACTAVTEMIRHELAHGSDREILGRMVTQMDEILRQAIQDVRGLSEEQYPPILKAFGLNAALQELREDLKEDFSDGLHLELPPHDWALEALPRLHLYRLLEELLIRCINDPLVECASLTLAGTLESMEVHMRHDGSPALWMANNVDSSLDLIHARCALLGARLEISHTTKPRDVHVRIKFSMPAESLPRPA